MTVKLKQGDTSKPFVGVLYCDGAVADLTDADAVYFYMKLVYGETAIGGTCTFEEREIDEVLTWVAEYAWGDTDLDVPGVYIAEFEVVWPGDKPETFPNGEYIKIEVLPDLGSGGTPK